MGKHYDPLVVANEELYLWTRYGAFKFRLGEEGVAMSQAL